MRILIAHSDDGAGLAWQRALAERLPAASIAQADGTPDAAGAPAPDRWADYAVGWNPPADLFERQPGLRAFFSSGAGVDHLLRHPGLPPTLPVFRLEDAGMAALMADYCLHELLHVAGRHHDYRRQQTQERWCERPTLRREDLPVGVVGMGVLGAHVARHLAGAGFPVQGFARGPKSVDAIPVLHGRDGWHRFLAATRVLILLAPHTPATADLIDADALSRLQPGAWLINVARGALVVDADLLAALDDGRLAGATLDVFRNEPLPAGHPFWRHPGIRVTPHVSAPTQIGMSAAQVAAGLLRLARGATPGGRVDRERGY
jgi:glyoxylate/hydroxypyruvate reductase A